MCLDLRWSTLGIPICTAYGAVCAIFVSLLSPCGASDVARDGGGTDRQLDGRGRARRAPHFSRATTTSEKKMTVRASTPVNRRASAEMKRRHSFFE